MNFHRNTHRSALVLYCFAVLAFVLLPGCSDSPTELDEEEPIPSGQIRVDGIILNPSSPAPGDTVIVTAVTTGFSAPGDFVQYVWSSNAGSFVENNLSTVRWVAPTTSAVYDISVSATNSVSISTNSQILFVGQIRIETSSSAGEFHLNSAGDAFYYLQSTIRAGAGTFLGFDVWIDQGATSQVTTRQAIGYVFNAALNRTAHTEGPTPTLGNQTVPTDVWTGDLMSGASLQVPSMPWFFRRPLDVAPYVSPDGALLALSNLNADQFNLSNAGAVDTFEVHTFDPATQMRTRVATDKALGSGSFHPSFSSDGNSMVFLSDRSGEGEWELYSFPVVGGVVQGDAFAVPLKLTDSGGAMGSGGGGSDVNGFPAMGIFKWNPDPADNILAIADQFDVLRLVPTDGSGATIVSAGDVSEIIWAGDGEKLALSTNEQIFSVVKTGVATLIVNALPGDRLSRIVWSPDGSVIVYAVSRGADVWYELLDLGGATGLSGPIRITAAMSDRRFLEYSDVCDVSPRWHPTANRVYVLLFDRNTARVGSIDLSGIIP